jgi:glucan phosphoethanolaminetransferase (alkaline phosphatase superfamily)
MDKKIQLELLFWLFTFLVTAAVLIPIYTNIPNYPFWVPNIVFVIAAITVTRYLFLLKYTFIARRQVLKIALAFLCIPLIFYLIQELNYFQTYLDEEGVDSVVGHLPYDSRETMVQYMRSEMLLFGTMAVISSILFPLRLIVSVWRTHNRGTV